MADKPVAFDARGFSETVRASLITGTPTGRLDGILRRIAAGTDAPPLSRLCLIVAQACLAMGRTKQVRHWLEQLLVEIEDDDLLAAIAVAVGSSQAELAVELYQKLQVANNLHAAEESLGVAQATVALALRLRLPMRGEAWGLHRKLLKAAGQLLLGVIPALSADAERAQAWSCLAEIYRLRGLAQSQVAQALIEAARYEQKNSTAP